jgi:glycosyltransferase involved in cell wall biosynthesis
MQPQRRRVLFLIPTLAGGGAERVIITLLNHLDRAKFDLSLSVLDTRGAVYLDQLPGDVTLFDLQVCRVRYALPKIVRVIQQANPHVVFSTLGHLNLALSIARPLLPRKPVYVARETTVVSELLRTGKLPDVWSFAYRNFYARFDRIVCQSLYMRDDLVANFRVPLSKTTLINNPLDIEKIKQLSLRPLEPGSGICTDGKHFLHLTAAGRLAPEKGFDLLIEAVALSGLKHLRVTVLGEGPLRGALEELARTRSVADQFRFAGFQKNPYPFMARADAFVLCSRYEGFPNVVLEALACGTHVIATPAPGGIGEIAKSVQGVQLASANSAEALSNELLKFAKNKPALGPGGLEKFRVGNIVREYERVLIDKEPRAYRSGA